MADPTTPKKVTWQDFSFTQKGSAIGGGIALLALGLFLGWFFTSFFRSSMTVEEALLVPGVLETRKQDIRQLGEARSEVARLQKEVDTRSTCASPAVPPSSSQMINTSVPAGTLSPKEKVVTFVNKDDLVLQGKAKFLGNVSDGRAIVSCYVPPKKEQSQRQYRPPVQQERIVQMPPPVATPAVMWESPALWWEEGASVSHPRGCIVEKVIPNRRLPPYCSHLIGEVPRNLGESKPAWAIRVSSQPNVIHGPPGTPH